MLDRLRLQKWALGAACRAALCLGLVACAAHTPDPSALRGPASGISPAPTPGASPPVIMAMYLPPDKLPASAQLRSGGASMPAASASPALLQNPQYEALTQSIAQRLGLHVRSEAYVGFYNVAAFDVPAAVDANTALETLRSDFGGLLQYAGQAQTGHAAYMPNDPDFLTSSDITGPQWGQHAVRCGEAWDYTRGSPGVYIGVVDTGAYLAHEELAAQVLDPAVAFPTEQLDIVNHDNTVEDIDGHGTVIAGLIAAKIDDGRAIAGVAPGCRVLPVKIADSTAFAYSTDMQAGCLLAAQLGARVVNLSWYLDGPDPSFALLLDQLTDMGALLVVSAGNDGSDISRFPAGYQKSLSVGAVGPGGERSSFSNYGYDIDVAAPGQDLESCGPWDTDSYVLCQGTSFSTPFVASGAGLLLSRQPTMPIAQMRSLLEQNGPLATGFSPGAQVRVLDLAAALGQVDPQASISGVVLSQSGSPLPNAVVALNGGETRKVDVSGAFRFAGLPDGMHTLTAVLSGFLFDPSTIEVSLSGASKSGLVFTGWPAGTPRLTSFSVEDGMLIGQCTPAGLVLNVNAHGSTGVAKVQYWLDLAPVGTDDSPDIHALADTPQLNFPAQFDLAGLGLPNQAAQLVAVPLASDDTPGIPTRRTVYIFNQLGDANADSFVDESDLAAYIGAVGLQRGDAGYVPFLDNDQDGLITEADAAAVGYFFGAG